MAYTVSNMVKQNPGQQERSRILSDRVASTANGKGKTPAYAYSTGTEEYQ